MKKIIGVLKRTPSNSNNINNAGSATSPPTSPKLKGSEGKKEDKKTPSNSPASSPKAEEQKEVKKDATKPPASPKVEEEGPVNTYASRVQTSRNAAISYNRATNMDPATLEVEIQNCAKSNDKASLLNLYAVSAQSILSQWEKDQPPPQKVMEYYEKALLLSKELHSNLESEIQIQTAITSIDFGFKADPNVLATHFEEGLNNFFSDLYMGEKTISEEILFYVHSYHKNCKDRDTAIKLKSLKDWMKKYNYITTQKDPKVLGVLLIFIAELTAESNPEEALSILQGDLRIWSGFFSGQEQAEYNRVLKLVKK